MSSTADPLVTIAVSVYNDAPTLLDMIRCTFSQTYSNWELLVVDDGSTDFGCDLIARIEDPRVRLIADSQNRGRPYRYNQLTGLARGKYLMRFDADDLIHPQKVQLQVEALERDSALDLVGTGMVSLDRQDRLASKRIAMFRTEHEDICAGWPLGHVALCHGGVMGRTSWFARHLYSETYRGMAEDLALWATTLHSSRFGNVPLPLYFYRDHATQTFRKYFLTKMAAVRLNLTVDRRNYSAGLVSLAVLGNLAKIATYAVATPLRMDSVFVRGRGGRLDAECERFYWQTMEAIRNIRVPGLSDASPIG